MFNWKTSTSSLRDLIMRALSGGHSTDDSEHIHCIFCGYDLTGVSVAGKCPECGLSMFRTVLDTVPLVPSNVDNPSEDPSRKAYEFVRNSLGYPVDAFLFIRDVVKFAHDMQRASDSPSKECRRQLTAAEMCAATREYALGYFGDAQEAIEVFREWNILRSEDIGRIVFHLVEGQILRPSRQDSHEDFAGLFTLETLFSD